MLYKKITSLEKKRNSDRCGRAGNASTAKEGEKFSSPLAKNARIDALRWGLYRGGCVIVTYRRAHRCSNMASRAHMRLMTKLRNQSKVTHTHKNCRFLWGEWVGWPEWEGWIHGIRLSRRGVDRCLRDYLSRKHLSTSRRIWP
jgi:hypothetical protein